MYACACLSSLWNGSTIKTSRIQFSLPMRFFGGPGMLSRTSLASLDFFMMTSLSRIAVCMRRTSIWLLLQETYSIVAMGHTVVYFVEFLSCFAVVGGRSSWQHLQILPFPAAAYKEGQKCGKLHVSPWEFVCFHWVQSQRNPSHFWTQVI